VLGACRGRQPLVLAAVVWAGGCGPCGHPVPLVFSVLCSVFCALCSVFCVMGCVFWPRIWVLSSVGSGSWDLGHLHASATCPPKSESPCQLGGDWEGPHHPPCLQAGWVTGGSASACTFQGPCVATLHSAHAAAPAITVKSVVVPVHARPHPWPAPLLPAQAPPPPTCVPLVLCGRQVPLLRSAPLAATACSCAASRPQPGRMPLAELRFCSHVGAHGRVWGHGRGHRRERGCGCVHVCVCMLSQLCSLAPCCCCCRCCQCRCCCCCCCCCCRGAAASRTRTVPSPSSRDSLRMLDRMVSSGFPASCGRTGGGLVGGAVGPWGASGTAGHGRASMRHPPSDCPLARSATSAPVVRAPQCSLPHDAPRT